MGLIRVTPATAELVTLADAKAHLRVDEDLTDEDDLVTTLRDAAIDLVESYLHRALLQQTWRLTLDAFPECDRFVRLPRPNLLAVTAVGYVDADGAPQTMAPADYVADAATLPGELALAYGASWPVARCQRNAVTITFTAGYGSAAAAVPKAIIAAVLLVLGDLYANREGQIVGTIVAENPTVVALLASHLYREAY